MKIIPLTKEQSAIIDDDDFERIAQYKWFADKHSDSPIVKFRARKSKNTEGSNLMHRFILNAPKNIQVDHINGNPLDNRKSNLRLATAAQNIINRKVKNQTGYKGVYFSKCKFRPFEAYISIEGKSTYLGAYHTAEEAARVYDAKAKEIQGEFAWLNFPQTAGV